MTITAHFNKDLPHHLAVAFVTAIMSMQDTTCQFHVTIKPTSQDHLSLTNVAGKVVHATMWEVPLGELFSAFDVTVEQEETPPELTPWLLRVRPLGMDIIRKGYVDELKRILARAGAQSLTKVAGCYRAAVERDIRYLHTHMEVTS